MLNYQIQLDRTFHALSDQARRTMVARLASSPQTVGALAAPLSMSLPAVMQHLSVLERAGLIRSEKAGRTRTCHIEPQGLSIAEQRISGQKLAWEHRLDQLATYLETKPTGEDNGSPP